MEHWLPFIAICRLVPPCSCDAEIFDTVVLPPSIWCWRWRLYNLRLLMLFWYVFVFWWRCWFRWFGLQFVCYRDYDSGEITDDPQLNLSSYSFVYLSCLRLLLVGGWPDFLRPVPMICPFLILLPLEVRVVTCLWGNLLYYTIFHYHCSSRWVCIDFYSWAAVLVGIWWFYRSILRYWRRSVDRLLDSATLFNWLHLICLMHLFTICCSIAVVLVTVYGDSVDYSFCGAAGGLVNAVFGYLVVLRWIPIYLFVIFFCCTVGTDSRYCSYYSVTCAFALLRYLYWCGIFFDLLSILFKTTFCCCCDSIHAFWWFRSCSRYWSCTFVIITFLLVHLSAYYHDISCSYYDLFGRILILFDCVTWVFLLLVLLLLLLVLFIGYSLVVNWTDTDYIICPGIIVTGENSYIIYSYSFVGVLTLYDYGTTIWWWVFVGILPVVVIPIDSVYLWWLFVPWAVVTTLFDILDGAIGPVVWEWRWLIRCYLFQRYGDEYRCPVVQLLPFHSVVTIVICWCSIRAVPVYWFSGIVVRTTHCWYYGRYHCDLTVWWQFCWFVILVVRHWRLNCWWLGTWSPTVLTVVLPVIGGIHESLADTYSHYGDYGVYLPVTYIVDWPSDWLFIVTVAAGWRPLAAHLAAAAGPATFAGQPYRRAGGWRPEALARPLAATAWQLRPSGLRPGWPGGSAPGRLALPASALPAAHIPSRRQRLAGWQPFAAAFALPLLATAAKTLQLLYWRRWPRLCLLMIPLVTLCDDYSVIDGGGDSVLQIYLFLRYSVLFDCSTII